MAKSGAVAKGYLWPSQQLPQEGVATLCAVLLAHDLIPGVASIPLLLCARLIVAACYIYYLSADQCGSR
jgi:hypothetical protein